MSTDVWYLKLPIFNLPLLDLLKIIINLYLETEN